MQGLRYEMHTYNNPDYPIIFHYDYLQKGDNCISPHWHLNIELLFVQSGVLKVTIDNEVLYAKQGDIVVINSNSVHAIESHSDEVYYFCLILDYTFCQELGFNTLNSKYNNLTNDPEMKNIFQLIVNEGSQSKLYFEKAIRALCHTMLILLHRNQITIDKTKQKEFIQIDNVETVKEIIIYINQNLTEKMTLDSIAQEVAISKYHMSRIFKQITFLTINQFINQLRLDYSQKLLMQTDINITEVAHESGFRSLSYFTKTYKKHFAHSPSEARSQVSNLSARVNEINLLNSVESNAENSVLVERYL